MPRTTERCTRADSSPERLTGQPGVGKTCLVYRYLYNTFGETISVHRPSPARRNAFEHSCPLADHRRILRHEESRGGRQALQLGHLGVLPAQLIWPPVALSTRPSSLNRAQDTAGQERFDSLSSFYCRGARAAIICFDLTDR